METLLGWVPLATFVLAAASLGLVVRRRSRWARALVLLAPPAVFGLAAALAAAAPPCPDFLDGPCAWNWKSDAAVLTGLIAFPFTVVAAATLLVATAAARASAAWRRRRPRGAGGRGRRTPR